jgi:hypothetical protein
MKRTRRAQAAETQNNQPSYPLVTMAMSQQLTHAEKEKNKALDLS